MGALYYIGSVALIVPLRMASENPITSGSAGFIVVNSCFSSSMVNLVLEHYANLVTLGSIRGKLLSHLWTMPTEDSIHEGDAAHTAARVRRDFAFYANRLSRPAAGAPLPAPVEAAPLPPAAVTVHTPAAAAVEDALAALPADWPRSGDIVFNGVYVRYSPQGPDVLKDLNVILPSGCHTAFVGRTGSGKSTTLMALSRLVPLHAGSITLDGRPTTSLPLRLLRSKLTVVSQDPLFFTASLRQNLDPFKEFSDEALLTALARVGLTKVGASSATASSAATGTGSGTGTGSNEVSSGTSGSTGGGSDAAVSLQTGASPLDFRVAERAQNLSLGEQQLLAAARSWLRKTKVLAVDEGTASIDARSEHLLQETVQREFAGTTVVQVAHRLASVIESHFIVVLQDGAIVEAGHPHQLLGLGLGSEATTTTTSTSTSISGGGGSSSGGLFASLVSAMPAQQARDLQRRAAAAFERDTDLLQALSHQACKLAVASGMSPAEVWRPGGRLV